MKPSRKMSERVKPSRRRLLAQQTVVGAVLGCGKKVVAMWQLPQILAICSPHLHRAIRGAQGVLPMRVGAVTSQLDLLSLTPLSVAG